MNSEAKKFDPRIGAKKAAKEAGLSFAASMAVAGGVALNQPEIANQLSAAVAGWLPPPYGLLAAALVVPAIHGLGKFGIDWAKRMKTDQPQGSDAVEAARQRYEARHRQ